MEEIINTMVRDFTEVTPRSKSEVRRRIIELLAAQRTEFTEELRRSAYNLGYDEGVEAASKDYAGTETVSLKKIREEALLRAIAIAEEHKAAEQDFRASLVLLDLIHRLREEITKITD